MANSFGKHPTPALPKMQRILGREPNHKTSPKIRIFGFWGRLEGVSFNARRLCERPGELRAM